MKKYIFDRSILSSFILFIFCLIIRMAEYFIIKTDETFISENFIHKLVGIVVLVILLRKINYKFKDIGFVKKHCIQYFLYGLLLGGFCFSISYFIEYVILYINAKEPTLDMFVNGFSLVGSEVKHTEIVFFILCILLNMINVIMEEGLFRGFFLKIINNNHTFFKANIIVALLFGVWHFVMPLRSYIYGKMSLVSLVVLVIGYIILSGMMSIKWGMLYKMTGSLFIGIGDHLFNNVIATNILHMVTVTGVDELQIIRILIAQMLSFAIIYIIYRKNILNTNKLTNANIL